MLSQGLVSGWCCNQQVFAWDSLVYPEKPDIDYRLVEGISNFTLVALQRAGTPGIAPELTPLRIDWGPGAR